MESPALYRGVGRDDLIKLYFYEGYNYRLIICFLFFVHGISLSLRHLKRRLQGMNLRRRMYPTSHGTISLLIQRELQGSGSSLGYRAMWKRLVQKHKVTVSRDVVMRMLSRIDPLGTRQRKRNRLCRRKYRSKGPNHIWHTDGYDKIKPYGFPIHGCIDGYARKVLWLKVGTSNNDPYVIAHHFLSSVETLKGTPQILRCDMGTENAHLAFIQPFLRRNGTDCFADELSFRYGRSVSNQAWWAHLRRCFTQWWIDLFQGMQNCGLYCETNDIHRDCLRLCFMHLIQQELNTIVHEWNTHCIRPSKDSSMPAGIPDELFFVPQVQGTTNYLCSINTPDLQVAKLYAEEPDPPASLMFLEAANELMVAHGLLFPVTVQDAVCVYAELVALFEAQI